MPAMDYLDAITWANYSEIEPNLKVKIPMKGPSNRQTGYGNHFIDLVIGMLAHGVDISVFPYFAEPPLPVEFLACMVEPWPFNAPVALNMANPFRLRRLAPHTIGISTWETTRLPPDEFEVPLLTQIDEVIVPCETNIETYQELCPDLKVHYIPEGIDTHFWTFQERDWSADVRRIGMFGALTYRKGFDIAVECFLEEFENDPSVELHIATTFFELPQFRSLPEQYSNIFVYPFGWATRERVREFYYSMHALFAPFRGEGFYLPGAEFMATGGVFISPCEMGPRAYHKEDTGYIIPSRFETVKHWSQLHGVSAAKFGEWLAYDYSDVRDVLRRFVDAPASENKIKSERAADQIPFLLNPDQIGQQVIDVFLRAYLDHT